MGESLRNNKKKNIAIHKKEKKIQLHNHRGRKELLCVTMCNTTEANRKVTEECESQKNMI